MALPARCRTFCSDPLDQGWQTSVVSHVGCGLHQERQSRERQRIWQSFSACPDQGKFYVCFGIDFNSYERQALTCSTAKRASKPLRRRNIKVCECRQRLLVAEKYEGSSQNNGQRYWVTGTVKYQEYETSSDEGDSRKAQGLPCGHRATYRSRETGRRPS